MKKLSLYIFLVLLLISNANASDKNYFAGFTYWDNLKQVQKNFYVIIIKDCKKINEKAFRDLGSGFVEISSYRLWEN